MPVKRQTSTKTKAKATAKPATSGAAKAAANGAGLIDWRSRLNEPAEKDPKKRVAMIRRAGTRIKTTARIDTIHPRWDAIDPRRD